MLSKSKGQILRVTAVFRILFQIYIPNVNGEHEKAWNEPDKISNEALCAAVDFVQTSTQHAVYSWPREASQWVKKMILVLLLSGSYTCIASYSVICDQICENVHSCSKQEVEKNGKTKITFISIITITHVCTHISLTCMVAKFYCNIMFTVQDTARERTLVEMVETRITGL